MKQTELLIATSNSGKLGEIRSVLGDLPIALLSLADFPDIQSVDEGGDSFAENAGLKAAGYAKQAGVLTLADDSGLVVDALKGAPGVHSARYLGEQASYAERIRGLLTELNSLPDEARTARFVCALTIASADSELVYRTEATCEGLIADAPRGTGGFGYDPVFIPRGFDQTFGELPATVKNRISHRGKALIEARKFIASLTATSGAG